LTGPPWSGTLQGSYPGHTLSATCTMSITWLTDSGSVEMDTFNYVTLINKAQANITIVFTLLNDNPNPAPCAPPASGCDYTYRGTFTAY
jgi:hypothetical protein